MPGAWVYMLFCGPRDLIYVGWTTDPVRRLSQHQAGTGAKFTQANQPVRLAALKCCQDRSAAQSLEVQLKQLSREQKLLWIQGHPSAGDASE